MLQYETIPPLVTTWYTIWAKVVVIVATYRRVVTHLGCRLGLGGMLVLGLGWNRLEVGLEVEVIVGEEEGGEWCPQDI